MAVAELATSILALLRNSGVDLRLGTPTDATQPRPLGDGGQAAFEAVIDAVTAPEVPPPSWFGQARRNAEARQELLDEFRTLSSEQVADLVGSLASNRRATAHRWQTERRIFSVAHRGQTLYPGFQFDPDAGRPKPAMADVLTSLPERMTGWALALWWTTPVDLLEWARPVDRIDAAPDEVVRVARAEAKEWAQPQPA